MDDIEAVFTNPDVFASTNVQDPLFPLAPEAAAILAAEDFDPIAVMSNRPEPDHGRIRVYTSQGFGNRRLKVPRGVHALEGGRADRRVDRHGSPAEYVRRWPFPLPAEIVFRLIGFRPKTT